MPEVSIIIPARNEEKNIARCLKSCLNQDYKNYEIIVIDGISEDRTRDIVKKSQKKHKNIKLLENKKKIASSAFNIGIKNAKGKFIAIVGSHTELEKDYLFSCLSCIQKTNAKCAGGVQYSIGQTTLGKAIAQVMNSYFGGSEFHYSKEEKNVNTIYMGFYKKEVFKKNGLFDENLIRSQDAEFNYRLVSKGGKIFLSQKIKSRYHCRETLNSLFKQFYGYGFYKAIVYKKYPQFLTIKQIAPLALILSLIVASVFSKPLFSLIISAYLLFIMVSSFFLSRSLKQFFYSLAILPTMQVAYGLGSLHAIISGEVFKQRWKKEK